MNANNYDYNPSLFAGQEDAVKESEAENIDRAQAGWKSILKTLSSMATKVGRKDGYEGVAAFYEYIHDGIISLKNGNKLDFGEQITEPTPPQEEVVVHALTSAEEARMSRNEDLLSAALSALGIKKADVDDIVNGKGSVDTVRARISKAVDTFIEAADKQATTKAEANAKTTAIPSDSVLVKKKELTDAGEKMAEVLDGRPNKLNREEEWVIKLPAVKEGEELAAKLKKLGE